MLRAPLAGTVVQGYEDLHVTGHRRVAQGDPLASPFALREATKRRVFSKHCIAVRQRQMSLRPECSIVNKVWHATQLLRLTAMQSSCPSLVTIQVVESRPSLQGCAENDAPPCRAGTDKRVRSSRGATLYLQVRHKTVRPTVRSTAVTLSLR